MRKLIGATIGVLVTYLFSAALAWDFNPADWGTFLRLLALTFSIVWGLVGLGIGHLADDSAAHDRARKALLNQRHTDRVVSSIRDDGVIIDQ